MTCPHFQLHEVKAYCHIWFFILTNEYLYILKMCITLHFFPLAIYFANIKSSVFKMVLRNAIIKYKKRKLNKKKKTQTTEFCRIVHHILLWQYPKWYHIPWDTANKLFLITTMEFCLEKTKKSDDVLIRSAAKTQVYLWHHFVGWKCTRLNSILSCSIKNHWCLLHVLSNHSTRGKMQFTQINSDVNLAKTQIHTQKIQTVYFQWLPLHTPYTSRDKHKTQLRSAPRVRKLTAWV